MRFRLPTLIVLAAVFSLLLWANLRERVIVSNSPRLFGLEDLVSVDVLSGWPIWYRFNHFLVPRGNAESFVDQWPDIDGVEAAPIHPMRFAVNVGVALTILAASAFCSEAILRWFGSLARQQKLADGAFAADARGLSNPTSAPGTWDDHGG